jgi:hypothetical protein
MTTAIAKAERLGATRLYLESNAILPGAVALYEAMGFRHLPPERIKPSHYSRADVFMERMMGMPMPPIGVSDPHTASSCCS